MKFIINEKFVFEHAWEWLVSATGLECATMPDIWIVSDPAKSFPAVRYDYPEDDRPEIETGIFDRLGTYFPDEYKVIMYKGLIDDLAAREGWPSATIFSIVLVHELVHALTHRGEDAQGRSWTSFGSAPAGLKELFAQWYTFKYLEKMRSIDWIMDRMADGQPEIYRTYNYFRNMELSAMNAQLALARRGQKTEIICNFCDIRRATTGVERSDTWLMRSWSVPSCSRCAPGNSQTWMT